MNELATILRRISYVLILFLMFGSYLFDRGAPERLEWKLTAALMLLIGLAIDARTRPGGA